jgi:hypothetical protein
LPRDRRTPDATIPEMNRPSNELASGPATFSRSVEHSVGRRISPAVRLMPAVIAPVLLIGSLTWPVLFTNSVFYDDWLKHLWLISEQSLAIRANHMPTVFVSDSHTVFEPLYAFYGGTIYTLAGGLSLVLGDAPIPTYVLTYMMAFSAAYGGWYWIGRMANLGRLQAQVPGLVFVTCAYYLQTLYATGDWPAFVGVSTIPLLIASTLSVLRSERMRMWPAVALVVSSIVFFGSHNITILWGSTLMVLTALVILACVPEARRQIKLRGATRVAGLAIPSALVNAWYLLPAVAYSSNTWIGSGYGGGAVYWRLILQEFMYKVSANELFTLSRAPSFPGQPNTASSLPVLVIAWVVVSIVLFLWLGRRSQLWLRLLLITSGMAVLIGVVMTHAGLILALPTPYTMVQYSVRLESFVLLSVTGAVLAVLVLVQRGAGKVKLWTWTLVPILIVSVVGAVEQVADFPATRPGQTRSRQLATYESKEVDYADASLPLLDREGLLPVVRFPPPVNGSSESQIVYMAPGELVDSNIGGGPELVHVTGARIVGVSPDLTDILEIGKGNGRSKRGVSAELISLSTADGLPIMVGRLVTVAALLTLVGEFALVAIRRRVRRR